MTRKRQWSNTFMVGMFKCEMTYTEGGTIKAKWTPDLPLKLERSSPEMLKAYRAGRNSLFEQIAKDTGASVMVIET